MSGLMAKAGEKMVKNKMKSEMKNLEKMVQPPPGGGSGRSTSDGGGRSEEGCCNRCTKKVCGKASIWTRVLCWAVLALVISTVVLWLGGAFLVGPAKGSTAHDQCGVSLNIPILNKDAYVFYLGTTGIIVTIMIFASCICCCSLVPLCSAGCPKAVRICGFFGFLLALLATSVYIGWVALGTYFVIKIHGGDTICRNTIIYLILLYVYLVILFLVGFLAMTWKCDNWSKDKSRSHRGRDN